jgi:hypothetical protein
VIAFMLGGMGLGLTSLTPAWRAIGRTIRRLFRDDRTVGTPAATEHVA